MKFTILFGSPRPNGNTAALLAPFLDECAQLGVESERIGLYGRDLRPWLGAVARNKAADRLRRQPPVPLPLSDTDRAPGPGPQEAVEQREWAERLWRAVEAMEEPDHTLFLRHYWYGDKLRDVARDLALNLSTAKSRLHRGRKALRETLTKGGNDL